MTSGALIFKGMPGRLELDLHRLLPDHASIRSCTFTREGRISRVALQIEVADVHTVRSEASNLVGIDWGVERLATLSTGETIANPRFGAAAARGIGKRRQRGPERPETGRSGSVERLCARKQRPGCRPSLRKPQARSSPPNSGKDFELRHYQMDMLYYNI